jgi:spore germination protein YaaH
MRSSTRLIRLTAVSAVLMIAVTVLSPISPGVAQSPPRKILTGWIPYYAMNTALPSAVANGDLIKEVMPFWYMLKSETKISDLYKTYQDSTKQPVPMSVPLATMRDSGFQIIPTITDGTGKYTLAKLLSVASTRTQVVNTITNLVVANNFDGIDLDFEGFAFSDGTTSWPATRLAWDAFILELSTSLHSLGKLLSVTTPVLFDPATGKKGYYVYDWATISPMIDHLRIMTYDYSVTSPGPIGPITWAEQAISYAVSVVAASKVYLGVPGYGRDWVTKVVGICPSDVSTTIVPGAKATPVMRDIADLAASHGATTIYNNSFGEATFTYQKVYSGSSSSGLQTSCTATRTVWYQNAQSFAARAQLVAKYRLGGITEWTLGMEDSSATDAVRQVAQAIAPDEVLSTVTTDQSAVAYGNSVNVQGLFQLPDKTPIAGLAVKLEMKEVGESNWRDILDSTTGPDGRVSTSLVFGKDAVLRFSSEATWDRLASQSAAKALTVGRLLNVLPPSSAYVGLPFSIIGAVQPHEAGVLVSLDSNIAGKWRTVGKAVVTDANGQFNLGATENTRGIVRYRINVVGNANLQGATSPIFAIVIY